MVKWFLIKQFTTYRVFFQLRENHPTKGLFIVVCISYEYFNIKSCRSFLTKKMIHEHHQKDLFCCLALIHKKEDQNWNDSLIYMLPERKHNTCKVIPIAPRNGLDLLFQRSTEVKKKRQDGVLNRWERT